jgi:hypothetical protein
MHKKQVDYISKAFPEGARVKLVKMDDRNAPPIGTLGTVQMVDDIGSILVLWDNGCNLSIIYGVDVCQRV